MLPTEPKLAPASATTTARFSCAADLHLSRTKCERVRPATRTSGARYDIVLTKEDTYLALDITNPRYTRSDSTYAADVAVTVNDPDGRTLGTRDGTSITGIKAFFNKGPAAFDSRAAPGDTTWPQIQYHFYPGTDTAAVRVRNPDGYGTFTAPNQPYFEYSEILDWLYNETQPRRWKFTVHPGVRYIFFEVGISAAYLGEPVPVPAVAPDTVPANLYDEQNIATDLPGMTGTYLRDVFTVLFTPDATAAERQSAIDQVGGTVVGGDRAFGTDGYYFVRIPGDGTARPMLNAISTLDARAHVIGAAPEFIDEAEDVLAYARPDDGAGWNKTDWSIDPNVTKSLRWGLEAIGAPMAWGCETGDPNTKIAVVDAGFYLSSATSDVQLNTQSQNFFAAAPILERGSAVSHGVQVASMIGARGDNQAGMTGLMWNANLRLYEAGTRFGAATYRPDGKLMLHTRDRVSNAIWSRAQVINVSIGATVSPMMAARIRAGAATRDDSTSVIQRAKDIRRPIKWARLIFHRPLIVFAAGNFAETGSYQNGAPKPGVLDAYWSGFPQLAAEFPDQVIAVGAAMRAGSPNGGFLGGPFHRAAFSQGGRLVAIAAPGHGVGGMDINGGVVPLQGTSFAAPLVTGAAGLLFSFDPRLTTAEVINLLVEGARRGNRYIEDPLVTSVPVLNIHESLKLAAQRPGAPLCGNRVWLEGGLVKTRRVVNGGEQIESLFASGPGSEWLQALHGGKALVFRGNDGWQYRTWDAGQWETRPMPDSLYDYIYDGAAPTNRSLVGLSHDFDSAVWSSDESNVLNVRVEDLKTHQVRSLGTLTYPTFTTSRECVFEVRQGNAPVECRAWADVGGGVTSFSSLAAYGPRGDKVYVAVNSVAYATQIEGEWHLCPRTLRPDQPQTDFYCRNTREEQRTTGSTLYAIPINATSAAQWVPVTRSANGNLLDIAVGDGSDELVVQERILNNYSVVRWVEREFAIVEGTFSWMQKGGSGGYSDTCTTQFRDISSGFTMYSRAGCGWSDFTLSPLRAGEANAFRR